MQKIIIQIGLLLFCVYTNAQDAFNNSGNLQIHAGASVSGFGDFTNTSSGVLVNNGNLYLKRALTNDQASMASGAGILYLDGSISQSVSGGQPFKTFSLVSDNSTGIVLNNNLHVAGTHTFTNGIISSSATPNYLVYEAGSSYSGDADSRHVNGWIKKIGNTNFVFPVGNGTIERTVAIGSLSANSEFNTRYLATTPNTNLKQPPVWNVDPLEYWAINQVSGGTATVTLNWDYSKVYFPNWIVPDILVTGFNGSLWVNHGGTASGTTTATGTITSNSISSFNLFTLGSRSNVLPLTLISFTAKRQDNYTQIAWTTANEFNMDRFVVERSDDNFQFYPIGGSHARNMRNPENYFSRDDRVIHNIAYYRLRCISNDGSEKFSQVVPVSVSTNDLLTLTLNPVKDKLMLLASSGLNGVFDYRLMAINGPLIQQGKISILNGGQYQLSLNENIKPGSYLLTVNNAAQHFSFKVVKN